MSSKCKKMFQGIIWTPVLQLLAHKTRVKMEHTGHENQAQPEQYDSENETIKHENVV